jgi:hypothetical protein
MRFWKCKVYFVVVCYTLTTLYSWSDTEAVPKLYGSRSVMMNLVVRRGSMPSLRTTILFEIQSLGIRKCFFGGLVRTCKFVKLWLNLIPESIRRQCQSWMARSSFNLFSVPLLKVFPVEGGRVRIDQDANAKRSVGYFCCLVNSRLFETNGGMQHDIVIIEDVPCFMYSPRWLRSTRRRY